MTKDMGGNDEFVQVTLDNTLQARPISGALIPENSLSEARWELQVRAGGLWQEGSRMGLRLWIIQDYWPGQAAGLITRPLARVYEDVLSGVAHVRGPATFFLAPNVRLMQYLAANPLVTITVYARVRFGDVTTQNVTRQRMMYTVTDLPSTDPSTVEIWGNIDARTATVDFDKVQWIGTGPVTGAGNVSLRCGESYYNGTYPLTDSYVANWGQFQSGQMRDMPPVKPTSSGPTPNLFYIQNDTPDTLNGEVWFYGP